MRIRDERSVPVTAAAPGHAEGDQQSEGCKTTAACDGGPQPRERHFLTPPPRVADAFAFAVVGESEAGEAASHANCLTTSKLSVPEVGWPSAESTRNSTV